MFFHVSEYTASAKEGNEAFIKLNAFTTIFDKNRMVELMNYYRVEVFFPNNMPPSPAFWDY